MLLSYFVFCPEMAVQEVSAASADGIWYVSVSDALSSAAAGTEVTLRKDAYLGQLAIPADITLNLDGKNLHIVSGITAFGQIVDKMGAGLLTLSDHARLLLSNDNCGYLPVFDGVEDGWCFAQYELVSLGVKNRDNALQFGFTIRFEDAAVYRLLSGTDQCGVGFALNLSWTGHENGEDCVFDAALIREFADLTISMSERGLPGEAALMLTVTGANSLPDGSYVQVTPVLTSTAGCESRGEPLQYS